MSCQCAGRYTLDNARHTPTLCIQYPDRKEDGGWVVNIEFDMAAAQDWP